MKRGSPRRKASPHEYAQDRTPGPNLGDQSRKPIRQDGEKFGKGLLAGASLATLKLVGQEIRQVVADVARLGDVAERIGIGTTELQTLQRGAAAADMDFEELTSALMTQRIRRAAAKANC